MLGASGKRTGARAHTPVHFGHLIVFAVGSSPSAARVSIVHAQVPAGRSRVSAGRARVSVCQVEA
jgi:hypothetical protein